MDAEAILSIPLSSPERLFSSPLLVEKEYRDLVKFWHPDHNKAENAKNVFAHIIELHNKAKTKIAHGNWETIGFLECLGLDGITRKIHWKKKHKIDLGEMYIGDTVCVFTIKNDFKDLCAKAKSRILAFPFASNKMQTEIQPYLPEIVRIFETVDRQIFVFKKTVNNVLLSDLKTYLKEIDPKHVAWILSSLYNLVCYFQHIGLMHGDISLDTYFVSPKDHSGVLLGGWWYNTSFNQKIVALPNRVLKIYPKILKDKTADSSIDLELIKALGRECVDIKTCPRSMYNWLHYPTTGFAIQDYKLWQGVLKESFGERRFTKLDVNPSAIYGAV